MSLSHSKLHNLRPLSNGAWQARCPACAESGQDRKGEHLRMSPDGKFGCCVYPGDHEHRRRIFVLAGDHGPKTINVRVALAKTGPAVQLDLSTFAKATVEDLGRLGRVFSNEDGRMDNGGCRTESPEGEIGTLGTPFSDPRAYANEPDLYMGKLIGSEQPVPSVPGPPIGPISPVCPISPSPSTINYLSAVGSAKEDQPSTPIVRRLPFLLPDGTLVIPFDSPERYHWWKGGQSVRQTVAELKERRSLDGSPF